VAKPAKHPVAPTKAPKATPKPTAIEKEVVTANAAASIPLLSELSSGVRGQIPPLNITGAVYSKNPGQRLLLVNNQVLNQGHLAAPEVTLEEIRPNTSVFSFRGTKFRMAH
jgi:general secretion pathway protein B